MSPPTLALRIHVRAARNLAAKDRNGFSDPYAIVAVGPNQERTHVVSKSLNPEWNAALTVAVPLAAPPLAARVALWDRDKLSKDDFLGHAHVALRDLPYFADAAAADAAAASCTWHALQGRTKNNTVSGDVALHAALIGDRREYDRLQAALGAISTVSRAASTESLNNDIGSPTDEHAGKLEGIVFLTVISASNLPAPKNMTRTTFDMDPFVVVTYAEQTFRTRTIKHNINPEWREKVALPIHASAKPSWPITLSVYDTDKFSANDSVGRASLLVADLPLGDEPETMVLPLELAPKFADSHVSALAIAANFVPMATLRAKLWRRLLGMFDTQEDGQVSVDELIGVLDTLGSTHTDELIDEGYKLVGKPPESALTVDQAVQVLEGILRDHKRTDEEAGTLTTLKACPLCGTDLNPDQQDSVVVHLAACLEGDHDSAGKLMMAGFVSEALTSRNAMTRLVHKITRGREANTLGANSGNIMVIDRETGQVVEEKIPNFIRLGIRLLYRSAVSPVELARVKRMLKRMTLKQAEKYNDPRSAREIPKFIAYHKLNTDEIKEPLDSFKCFNDFFFRELKPGMRPVASPVDETVAVCGADCRLMAFESISEAQEVWIKGRNFSLPSLLGCSAAEAAKYAGGSLVIFRLAPQDYHRFHTPVSGVVAHIQCIEGTYFTVNPMAIRSTLDVYLENARAVVTLRTLAFGDVAFVAVGAMMVGSILLTQEAGAEIKRGDELGYFAFGGSTVVLVFEKDRIKLDADLLTNARRGIETLVRVGMSLGKATAPTTL